MPDCNQCGETLEWGQEYLLNNYPGMEVVSTEPETEADTDDDERDTEICGADMSDGSTCERLADECPYH